VIERKSSKRDARQTLKARTSQKNRCWGGLNKKGKEKLTKGKNGDLNGFIS